MSRIVTMAFIALVAACGAQDRTEQAPAKQQVRSQAASTEDLACARIVSTLPSAAREEGWDVVTRATLLASDLELWNTSVHAADCPGVAIVDLNGDGQSEFAVTLVQRREGALFQKLMLVRRASGSGAVQTLWEPQQVPFAYVVFRTDAAPLGDFYSGETSRPQHDVFVFERMEAWDIAYYEAQGELRHVLISD